MKSNRTELALIARGIDSELAKQLRLQGLYLKSLRLMAKFDQALAALQLPGGGQRTGSRAPTTVSFMIAAIESDGSIRSNSSDKRR